jgi:SAM-dependent methyltransferase
MQPDPAAARTTAVTAPTLDVQRPEIEVLPNHEDTSREMQQKERWNGLAPSQLERTRGNARQPGVDERQEELMVRHPQLCTPGSTILDCGAGVGCATNKFREAGAHVIAIEPAPEMAKLTRDVPVVPYAWVIQSSITEDRELSELNPKPINAGTVDCVVCYGAFQNFPSRGANPGEFDELVARKALDRMYSLLKPGGAISIEYLQPQAVTFHESTATMDPVRFQRLFEDAGFQVVSDKPVFAYINASGQEVQYHLIEGVKPLES